jgi:hypothetical protein
MKLQTLRSRRFYVPDRRAGETNPARISARRKSVGLLLQQPAAKDRAQSNNA